MTEEKVKYYNRNITKLCFHFLQDLESPKRTQRVDLEISSGNLHSHRTMFTLFNNFLDISQNYSFVVFKVPDAVF